MASQPSEVKENLFNYQDYKLYLKDWIRAHPHQGHGIKSELARAAQCQTAYLSRIIDQDAHISVEQAVAIQGALAHSREDARYFLLLVQFGRAGTTASRSHFQSEIDEARKRRGDLRFHVRDTLSEKDRALYYSSYQYAAIHVCLTVPELQSPEALARFMRISKSRLDEILTFLLSCGLAQRTETGYRVGESRLHLNRDSPLIRQHHANWRMEALRSLDRGVGAVDPDELHYSAVVSLSRDDCFKLKELWNQTLETFNKRVADSKEETVKALVLDFFSLG